MWENLSLSFFAFFLIFLNFLPLATEWKNLRFLWATVTSVMFPHRELKSIPILLWACAYGPWLLPCARISLETTKWAQERKVSLVANDINVRFFSSFQKFERSEDFFRDHTCTRIFIYIINNDRNLYFTITSMLEWIYPALESHFRGTMPGRIK